MAEAICSDNTNDSVGDEDLQFINDMKNDPSTVIDDKRQPSYHSRKRNSSFSEYFEGDLSQNLLSRNHFLRRDSELQSETVNAIVNRISEKNYNGLRLILKEDNRKQNSQANLVFLI